MKNKIDRSGGGPLYEKSYLFAKRIVLLARYLQEQQKEYILSKQLLKSGTSVGANIVEAKSGISGSDFTAKYSIAYKEAQETIYWLDLLYETDSIDAQQHASLHTDCTELAKMLYASLKTSGRYK